MVYYKCIIAQKYSYIWKKLSSLYDEIQASEWFVIDNLLMLLYFSVNLVKVIYIWLEQSKSDMLKNQRQYLIKRNLRSDLIF